MLKKIISVKYQHFYAFWFRKAGMAIFLTALGIAKIPDVCAQSSSTVKGVLLPNGQEFEFWDDQTVYTKTYFVDQNHPDASNENPGTHEKPFLTINKAAQVLLPGEKVIVKKGIYRENIEPARGGESKQKMICYEAYENDKVIISGAKVLMGKWEQSRTPYNPALAFSQKMWMIQVPKSFFKDSNPFLVQNADSMEMKIMSWAKDWTNHVPYMLLRGIVFQDNQRLTQLAAYEDVVKLPGSFWVDTTQIKNIAFTLHVYPFDGVDPNKHIFELTTSECVFRPIVKGSNFIHIKGFTIEKVGNGFQRSGKGAITTYGGSNWIIENNIVRGINSVGIEIGAITDEHLKEGSRNELEQKTGKHIVRNNKIFDCGIGGIQGLINYRNLVENNLIHDIGWQEAEFYYETAAIKLLETHDCLVQKNYIHHTEGANGIWLDWDNVNSRVSKNILYKTSSDFGAVFIEASRRTNLVDNNIVWDCERNGIYQHDSDSLLIVHNLIGQSKEYGVKLFRNEGRMGNGKLFTAKHNRVMNNILINNSEPFSFIDNENISDWNAISISKTDTTFNLNDWQNIGHDKNSYFANITASFDPKSLKITIKYNGSLPLVKKLPFLTDDILGNKYDKDLIVSGPFKKLKSESIDLTNLFKLKDYE